MRKGKRYAAGGEASGSRPVRALAAKVDDVVRALEAKGVAIEADGVRLKKPRAR